MGKAVCRESQLALQADGKKQEIWQIACQIIMMNNATNNISNINNKTTSDMSKNSKYDDLMLAIREDGEKEELQKMSDVTLEQIRKEHALFQGLLKAMREAREECASITTVLQAAKNSADNAIGGICAAIVKAENTSIKARLDDASFRLLDRLHAKWLEQEKQVLGEQFKQQEVLWQKQGARLVNIMKNNEGVWISKRLFCIVAILSLLSIGIIAIEIYYYVYFNWIA